MSFPTTPLGALLREPLRNGKSARASANDEGVRVFTLTAVTKADFSEENTKVSVLRPEDADGLWAQPGDIFIERSNTPELVGTAALYTGRRHFAVFPDLLIRVRADERLDERYLAHFLHSESARRYFKSKARGIAGTMPKISQETIESLRVPVPDRPAQARIVAAIETHFSRLDAAVASLTRAKANVKRARASVLKAAVEGRLVPTEAALARAEGRDYEPAAVLLDRILAERKAAWAASGAQGRYKEPVKPESEALPGLPEGWCWATVEQLTEFVTSGSRGWAQYYAETGPLFVRSQDINTYHLDLSGVARVELPAGAEGTRTRLAPGDVLVIITGANVTISAWVPQDVGEAYVNQHVALCRPVDATLSAYTHVWLRADGGGRPQLERAAYGAGKPGLNLGNIRDVLVALPPLAEQHRIVAEVDRRLSVLDALDATLDANLVRCTRLRQAILMRAFEGRLVPAVADEPRLAAEPQRPLFAERDAP
jgi:type I restriction enzyme S subunit